MRWYYKSCGKCINKCDKYFDKYCTNKYDKYYINKCHDPCTFVVALIVMSRSFPIFFFFFSLSCFRLFTVSEVSFFITMISYFFRFFPKVVSFFTCRSALFILFTAWDLVMSQEWILLSFLLTVIIAKSLKHMFFVPYHDKHCLL